MKIYLAGLYASSFDKTSSLYRNKLTDEEKAIYDTVTPYILESYHYIGKGKRMSSKIRETNRRVFLDSGAFSSFTKGVTVNIEDYVRFIMENKDIIIQEDGALCASVLDAIGDYKSTFWNQAKMQELGVTPLPCYHYGEPKEVLDYYVQNYPYMTIGGMVPISTPQLKIWLDRIWQYIVDEQGKPKTKVHGFGLTTLSLMQNYPWYSVDSSAWVQAGSVGNIYFNHRTIPISEHSPARKKRDGHYDNLPKSQQEAIREYVEGKGFSIERLRANYYSRWLFNCVYFKELNEHITKDKPTTYQQKMPGLFK